VKYTIQEINQSQDQDIKNIIQQVGAEFGAVGEGFGPSDPEVNAMSQYYRRDLGSRYLVALVDDVIVGGCGIAPFNDLRDICELRKLFLLPQSRGLGIGKRLAQECLSFATSIGYQQCYLDTLTTMTSAIHLYENLGFTHLNQPLQGTIHNRCDVWMIKIL
jgi:putative acetyltransferase